MQQHKREPPRNLDRLKPFLQCIHQVLLTQTLSVTFSGVVWYGNDVQRALYASLVLRVVGGAGDEVQWVWYQSYGTGKGRSVGGVLSCHAN